MLIILQYIYSYYLCLNGMLRDEQFSCPKGTLFNSDRETCDIPDNFICVHVSI